MSGAHSSVVGSIPLVGSRLRVRFFALGDCKSQQHQSRQCPKTLIDGQASWHVQLNTCSPRVSERHLKVFVTSCVKCKNFLTTQVEAYLGRAHETLAEKERLLENRTKEMERIRQDIDRTHRLYLDGEIGGEAFGKFFRPIEERQKQLEEEFPKLQAEIDFLKVDSLSSDQVINDATYLQENWPGLERSEKRKIVECITNKIVVSKEEITIDLCYLPSPKELTKRHWSLGGSNP